MNRYFRTDLTNKKPAIITVPQRRRMMCLNESCLDPYQAIKEQFLKRMEQTHLNRYLSPQTAELRAKLAEYAGCGIGGDNLIWGNGADDVLYHIFLSVRENEKSFAVSLAPSYFDYKTFCDAVDLKIKFLDLNKDFSFDSQKYLELASHPDCKLAILCNPNNPTGNLYTKEQLRGIVDSLPDKLVLIDETYYEFSDTSFLGELEQHPNIILTRSFSKAFSGAGLRFGYALSSAENIHELSKVFQTFHTSILSQAFALTILDNVPIFCQQVLKTIEMRKEMYEKLSRIPGLTVHPSHTNFLTFTIGERSAELFEFLKEREIALREVGAHPRLKNCLRATLSCEEDNDAMYQAILEFLKL
ncbi:MAG TPA: histidinol-phosphate transaminase [Candidatus Cloacimonadota bacterium]|nr:histidinol-phosphate transaminase [Candidatus Cloacimonadota bacterium]